MKKVIAKLEAIGDNLVKSATELDDFLTGLQADEGIIPTGTFNHADLEEF